MNDNMWIDDLAATCAFLSPSAEEMILLYQAMWSPLFLWRFSSAIQELFWCKWADSVSRCVLEAYRGGDRGAKVCWGEVSFICIRHTPLLCYSDSTIILITVCLSLPPPTPPPAPLLLLLFLLTRKMMYLQTDLQHFSFQQKKSYLCRCVSKF